MDDERQQDIIMGLVLTYNVVGLMLNYVSQYIHEKLYYADCTGSSMYICPNSLYIYIYIQDEVVQCSVDLP